MSSAATAAATASPPATTLSPTLSALEPSEAARAPSVLRAPWARTQPRQGSKGAAATGEASVSPPSSSTAASGSGRSRLASLYSTASVAPVEDHSLGSTTYDYDVNAQLRNQQARRRQGGGSIASVSTMASGVSYAPSVTSHNVQGEFYVPASAASSIRRGISGPRATEEGGHAARPATHRHGSTTNVGDGTAADALRRVRKASIASHTGGKRLFSAHDENGDELAATLTDTLEHIIANSASYRAVGPRRSQYGTFAGTAMGDDSGSQHSQTRQRVVSNASARNLSAFTSTAQRQSAMGHLHGMKRGDGTTEIHTARGASMAPPARTMSLFAFGGPQRAPTMAPPIRTAQASVAMPSTNAMASGIPASRSQADALGSLRGLRGFIAQGFLAPQSNARHPSSPSKRTGAADRSLRPTPTSPSKPKNGRAALQNLSLPPSPSTTRQTGKHAQPCLSHDTLKTTGSPSPILPASPGADAGGSSAPARRTFASIDPTSRRYGSAVTSGAAPLSGTPTPAESLLESRKSSRVNLAADGGESSGRPSLSRQETSSSAASGQSSSVPPSPRATGTMPPLDSALARAEEQSGLKTSSRCMQCGKQVVNAPVTRSGDVFCSRDCRIAVKRTRQQKQDKEQRQASPSAASDTESGAPAASFKPSPAIQQQPAAPRAAPPPPPALQTATAAASSS